MPHSQQVAIQSAIVPVRTTIALCLASSLITIGLILGLTQAINAWPAITIGLAGAIFASGAITYLVSLHERYNPKPRPISSPYLVMRDKWITNNSNR